MISSLAEEEKRKNKLIDFKGNLKICFRNEKGK